jgi:hypothetical protein
MWDRSRCKLVGSRLAIPFIGFCGYGVLFEGYKCKCQSCSALLYDKQTCVLKVGQHIIAGIVTL